MLKEARDAADMTQQKLAAKLGKPQSFVAKYEAGERRLDVVELVRVLRALDRSPAEFVAALEQAIKD